MFNSYIQHFTGFPLIRAELQERMLKRNILQNEELQYLRHLHAGDTLSVKSGTIPGGVVKINDKWQCQIVTECDFQCIPYEHFSGVLDLQDKGTSVIEKPSEDLASEPKEKRKQTPTEERTDVSRKKADEKTDDAVKKGKDKTDVTVKKAKEKTDVAVKKATDKTDVTVKKVKEKTDVAVKKAKEKTDKAVKKAKVLGSEEGVRRNAEVEAAHVP